MEGSCKTNGQDLQKRVNLARVEFVEKLHELNEIQSAISSGSGEVMTMLDEVETFLDVRMDRIRRVRATVRERQKHSRRLQGQCAELLTQVLGS